MKKIITFLLALNFVGCSTNQTENDSNQTAKVEEISFSPEPTPLDYQKANYPNFMKNLDFLANKTSPTKKTASTWVNAYIPDPNFRLALINIGAGQEDAVIGDNYIKVDTDRYGLDLSSANITDLTGIEKFTSVVQLLVNGNNLTVLDVSSLKNLQWLNCSFNKLSSLDLNANTSLYQIWCNNNTLTSLKLPANTSTLWGLWCFNNQLPTLDLNGNAAITDLFLSSNKITNLGNSSLPNLKQINCSLNNFNLLDFNTNTKLTKIWCFRNSFLSTMSIKNGNNTAITTQDFRYNYLLGAINVDDSFLPFADTSWPNKGNSSYAF